MPEAIALNKRTKTLRNRQSCLEQTVTLNYLLFPAARYIYRETNHFVFIMNSSSALLWVFALCLCASSAWGDQQCNFDVSEHSYHCALRTLQDGLQDDIDIVAAKKLKVKCADLLPLESQMKSEHFGNLPALEELDIEFCKIRQLPTRSFSGLTNLKKLTLQSHNSEWSSIMMEVDVTSFHNLDKIEDLNMAHNNLWSVPEGVLCNLPALNSANLSRNHLLEVSDLNLASDNGCKSPLATLDLSYNYISTLESSDLIQASSLKQLSLANNRISILGDNALTSVRSLQELNLANNQLAALPPTLFNESQALEKLSLQNNSLTLLTPGIFAGLSGLVMLNLSRNAISSHLLSEDTFSGLSNLQVLDLSYNEISKIEANTFAGLSQLQVLHLQHNKVHTVKPNSFLQQAQLQMLVLSYNKIEKMSEESLAGLSKLNSLSLDNNKLRDVALLPTTSPILKDLAMNNNQLTAIPSFIKAIKQLRTLDLGDNSISEIKPSDFSSLSNLYGLRMASNHLTKIVNGTFAGADNIHILNLAHNQIQVLEGDALGNLKELRALRLDNNRIEDINGIASSLSQLQWFNVSTNQLQWFDYAFIPKSLEWLDLSDNLVQELGNFYKLRDFGLKTIHVNRNNIVKVTPSSFPLSLENVFLGENGLEEVEPFSFELHRDLKEVDLRNNEINSLYKDALRVQNGKAGNYLSMSFTHTINSSV